MAYFYVSSVDGTNGGTSVTWGDGSHTTYDLVSTALALISDNDIILVDSAHNAAPAAAINWDVPVSGYHVAIISVNRAAAHPENTPLAGATETVNTNAQAFSIGNTIGRSGYYYLFGITCSGNSGGNSANTVNIVTSTGSIVDQGITLDSCTIKQPATSTSTTINFGSGGSNPAQRNIIIKDSSIYIKNTTSGLSAITFGRARVEWRNTTIVYSGATKPNSLFGILSGAQVSEVRILDSDLTGYEKSGGAIWDVTNICGPTVMRNCKLSATPALETNSITNDTGYLLLLACETDSHTKYRYRYEARYGILSLSSSIYANDGPGATYLGTNYGWQVVTNSSCGEFTPFVTPWFYFLNSQTTSMSPSLELDFDNATDLTNRTAWANFEYLSSGSYLLGTMISTRNTNPFIGTGTALTSSSIAWAGTGGFSNEKKRKITSTFTPAQAGVLRARLQFAIASFTGYVDPLVRGTQGGKTIAFSENGIQMFPSGGVSRGRML